jgi:hypothetical protein
VYDFEFSDCSLTAHSLDLGSVRVHNLTMDDAPHCRVFWLSAQQAPQLTSGYGLLNWLQLTAAALPSLD